MFNPSDIPYTISEAPDGLYGDVELFLKSYDEGEQAAAWSRSAAQNAVSNDKLLRSLIGSSLVPGCS